MRLLLVCIVACQAPAESVTDDLKALKRQKISAKFTPKGDAIKVAFFDADSTLRVSASGSVSANGPKDVLLLPFVAETLGDVAKDGFYIHIISNQGGVGSAVTIDDADAALAYTIRLIEDGGGTVHSFDFAENKDEFRKPQPGMGKRLEQLLQAQFGEATYIDKDNSYMVGDSSWKEGEARPDGRDGFSFSNADRLFAENYGIGFYEPQDFFGWVDYGVNEFEDKAQLDAFTAANP